MIGFAGRELSNALKVFLKAFCTLTLNDAALIRQIFYVHTFWDQLPPMSRMSVTSTIYLIVVFEVADFLVNGSQKPMPLSPVGWVAVFWNELVFQMAQQRSAVSELSTVQCIVIILNNSKNIICLKFVIFLPPTFKPFDTWWNDKLVLWRNNMLTTSVVRQPLLRLLLLTMVGYA